MKHVLLFDFDGTIADSFENFLEIINMISVTHKLPIVPRDELEKLRSESARALIQRLRIPFYKIPVIARDMKRLQQQYMADIKPFQGIPEVIHSLKKLGYTLGIVTSNGKDNVEAFIRNNNMDVFDYMYNDTSVFGKSAVLQKFLKQHAITNGQVIYIGDEIRDIEACQNVGIQIIAVTWGFNSKEGLEAHHPDFLIHKPLQLLKVLGA